MNLYEHWKSQNEKEEEKEAMLQINAIPIMVLDQE